MHRKKKERFYMKENILITLAILILATMWFQIANTGKNRYDVITSNSMLTILVDKKTGETWRNCICGEKSNVPGCWEKMITINPEPFNKPAGEVKALKKMEKLIKKQQKLQQEKNTQVQPEQPAKPVQNQQ